MKLERPPIPTRSPDRSPEAEAAIPQTVENRLRATIGAGRTEVTFPCGQEGNPWYGLSETGYYGWTAEHLAVERDGDGMLQVETDEGMLYMVPEDRPIYIGPPRDNAAELLTTLEKLTPAITGMFTMPLQLEEVVEAVDAALFPDPVEQQAHNETMAQVLDNLFPDALEELPPPAAPAVVVSDDQDEDEEEPERPLSPENEPQFLYLAGTAGTGKSYQARERATKYRDAILLATTGIAAVNLGGTTINSVLRYYDTADLQTQYEFGRLGVALHQLANSNFLRLIVDEVSMMDGHQLDIICLGIDAVNEKRAEEGKPPMGLTLVGDFAQLPPVKAPFAFERPSWSRFEPNTTLLTEPRRQADPAFVRGLQAVRRGDRKAALEYFGKFLAPSEDKRFDGTCILAKNDEVDRFNKVRMLNLPGPEEIFDTTRGGAPGSKPPSEWKQIPDKLVMKPNALVMILANRKEPGTTDIIYANGDLGHYLGRLGPNTARVKLLRNDQEVFVQLVMREKRTATGALGVKKARTTKDCWIQYMPLRVAYASTVHKSQGLSLDRVQVMMNSQFWMQPGMAYVALSRARTPEGLRIVCSPTQFEARINVNPAIRRWL